MEDIIVLHSTTLRDEERLFCENFIQMIIRTFLLAATSKYGPLLFTSLLSAAVVTAVFLVAPLGLFKLLLDAECGCLSSPAKSLLFCFDESRCEPCTGMRKI